MTVKKKRRTKKSVTPGLNLPAKKSTLSKEMTDFTILVYGAKKVGKTSLIAQFPDVFFLFCEKNDAVEVFCAQDDSGCPITLRDWDAIDKWVHAVVESGNYSAICIDTLKPFYEAAFRYVCEDKEIDHPNELGFGQGWDAISKLCIGLLQYIEDSPCGLIMLAHDKWDTREDYDGNEIEVLSVGLSGKFGEYVSGNASLWLYFGLKGDERRLFIRGSQTLEAGSRLSENFLDSKTSVPLRDISMGGSAKEAYKNLYAAFNNNYHEAKEIPKKKKRKKKAGFGDVS